MSIINTKDYRDDGLREFNFFGNSFKEAKEKVISNHFVVSTIHKLFVNVKAGSLFSMKTDDSYINNNNINLNFENLNPQRKIILDVYSLYYNNNFKNKLNIIGEVPEPFSKSFLSLELSLIQKMMKENPQVELSDYGNRLVKLCNTLYNKDLIEIVIDEKVVENFIEQQNEQFKNIQNLNSKIDADNKRLENAKNEIKRLSSLLEEKNSIIEKDAKKINDYLEENISLNNKRENLLKESMTLFDKIKIKIFEKLGVSDIYDITVKSKEKRNPEFSFIKETIRNNSINKLILEDQNKFRLNDINDFRKMLENANEKKTILEKTLISLEETKREIRDNLINPQRMKDVSVFEDKTLKTISKNNVFSIHVFPNLYPEETSPLNELLSPKDKINAIRAFNPALSTSTYVLNGEDFDNSTFGRGIRGVILGKGNINSIHMSDAGSVVNSNGERAGFGYQNLSEDIPFLAKRSNKNNSYNEVIVDNSVPYAEIIQIDQAISLRAESLRENKKEHDLNIREWMTLIDNVLNEGKDNKYDLEPLPLVLMLNGKLIEVSKIKPVNLKELPEHGNVKDLESVIKQNFFCKEIENLSEITKVNDILEKDIRVNIAKDLIGKYKSNVASFIEKSLKNKHDIVLKM